jgi:hypothetical protein
LDDAKLKLVLTVAGGLGSIAAILKTCVEYGRNLSLPAKYQKDLAATLDAASEYAKLSSDDLANEDRVTIKTHLNLALKRRIDTLRVTSDRLNALWSDPVSRLGRVSRAFLIYRSTSWRVWPPRILAYSTCVWLLLTLRELMSEWNTTEGSIPRLIREIHNNVENVCLLCLLAGVVLLFRSWALAEYRRQSGFQKKANRISTLLLFQVPENIRMGVAQGVFLLYGWFSITIYVFVLFDEPGIFTMHYEVIPVVLLAVPIYLVILRGWAAAELALSTLAVSHHLSSLTEALSEKASHMRRSLMWPKAKLLYACLLILVSASILFVTMQATDYESTVDSIFTLLNDVLLVYAAARTLKIRHALSKVRAEERYAAASA